MQPIRLAVSRRQFSAGPPPAVPPPAVPPQQCWAVPPAVPIRGTGSQVGRSEFNAFRFVIGSGFLDVVAMFRTLHKIDFPKDGSISLEYESNPDNPIDDIQQCLVVAQEAIE